MSSVEPIPFADSRFRETVERRYGASGFAAVEEVAKLARIRFEGTLTFLGERDLSLDRKFYPVFRIEGSQGQSYQVLLKIFQNTAQNLGRSHPYKVGHINLAPSESTATQNVEFYLSAC